MIKFKDSSFLCSASNIKNAPPSIMSEIAILGRSNVGKSSFINSLLNQKLALSSSTPGKTRLINFFKTSWIKIDSIKNNDSASQDKNTSNNDLILQNQFINAQNLPSKSSLDSKNNCKNAQDISQKIYDIHIIDFPGFGYAKVQKSLKNEWDKNLSEFLKKRYSIKLLCHLIDSRHLELEIDKNIDIFLKNIKHDCEILKIYTKCDKLNKNDFLALKRKGVIMHSNVKNSYFKKDEMIETIIEKIANIVY